MLSYPFCSIAAPEELLFTPSPPRSQKSNRQKKKLKIPPKFQAINLLVSEFLLLHPSEHIKGLICLCTNYTRHAVKVSGSGEQKCSLEYNTSKTSCSNPCSNHTSDRSSQDHVNQITLNFRESESAAFFA